MSDDEYLRRILTARVYDVVDETPLDHAPVLSERVGNRVLLKREDLLPTFSFKIRGAYNKMARLPGEVIARGVITSSAGNHAQGVARSARILGCPAVIVMPETAPQLKIDAVRASGAEVVLFGANFDAAFGRAAELTRERGLTFVHPFDDPEVIAGQGTVGMEILRQHPRPIHAVFVPVGGGGLIAGIATYLKQLTPDVRVIGVQTRDADAMGRSLDAGKRIELTDVGLFSDGTAVKLVGEETFRLASAYVDDVVRVDTDEVCAAIKDVFEDTRAILEPAGALAVAGLKAYAASSGVRAHTLVAIASGANMNFDRLRFVSERAEIGERREAVFAVTIPEVRGSFRRFCELVGDRGVTEFNYRIADPTVAHIYVGIQVTDRAEAARIAESFRAEGLDTLDLTDDELAKLHLRHLVGGHSPHARGERLFRVDLPERAGALMALLTAMDPTWNISLFHYRNHGADVGRVLVGMQVPDDRRVDLGAFFGEAGYRVSEETGHPAYAMFLGSASDPT